jgi:hypothetical protein
VTDDFPHGTRFAKVRGHPSAERFSIFVQVLFLEVRLGDVDENQFCSRFLREDPGMLKG